MNCCMAGWQAGHGKIYRYPILNNQLKALAI
jgi:hypothetical protein